MKVSLIVPTYNEKKDIENCILSLKNQSYKNTELIVIDDGSNDGTLNILKQFKRSDKNFHFARQNHKGAGAARNYGANLAKGEIFVFVDADMTFDRDFVLKLTDKIIKNEAKGTFSKEELVSNWDNVWARGWNLNEGWVDKKRHPIGYPDAQPVFRAILASEFKKVGGFTPGGYDDDWSLSKKLGYLAVNAPGAVFYHKNPSSLNEVFRHAKWVGKRNYKFGKIGAIYALFRSSLPVSLLAGMAKSLRYKYLFFLIFKIVYDLGIFLGILSFLLTGRKSK
jgi:glycosyltransferase involved in cell wall biosynthesis